MLLSAAKTGWLLLLSFGGHFPGPHEPHASFDTEQECLHALDVKQRAAYDAVRVSPRMLQERHPEPWQGVVFWWMCRSTETGDEYYHEQPPAPPGFTRGSSGFTRFHVR